MPHVKSLCLQAMASYEGEEEGGDDVQTTAYLAPVADEESISTASWRGLDDLKVQNAI